MIRRRNHTAFTLIELLIVIALIGILAAAVLPNATPTIHEQLYSAARIMAADLAYARSLAVANNSQYRIAMDVANNRYVLEHSGTNPALDTLPHSAMRSPDDPADQHIVRLDDLAMGIPVQIQVVHAQASLLQVVDEVEFGPMGGTTRAEETVVWLGSGAGPERRYLSVRVNPVTGLTWVESYQATSPPSVTSMTSIIN